MLKLPTQLDLTMVDGLKRELLTAVPGETLEAGEVSRVTSPGLQVLAAARLRDPALTISNPSPALREAAAMLALNDVLGIADV